MKTFSWLVVASLIAMGLIYMARMLWMLGRRAAQLQAGIVRVRTLRDQIEPLSKQTSQLEDNTRLVPMEVKTVLEELWQAQIRNLPSGITAMLEEKSAMLER